MAKMKFNYKRLRKLGLSLNFLNLLMVRKLFYSAFYLFLHDISKTINQLLKTIKWEYFQLLWAMPAQ